MILTRIVRIKTTSSGPDSKAIPCILYRVFLIIKSEKNTSREISSVSSPRKIVIGLNNLVFTVKDLENNINR